MKRIVTALVLFSCCTLMALPPSVGLPAQSSKTGPAPQPVVGGAADLGSPAYDSGWFAQTSGQRALITNVVSTGANRLLLVCGAVYPTGPIITPTSVTCSNIITGVTATATQLYLTNVLDGSGRAFLYYLIAPPSGSNDIHILMTGAAAQFGAAAIVITNADQSVGVGSVVADYGSAQRIGVTNTVTCGATDLVADMIGTYANTATYTPGTGQTQRQDSGGSSLTSVRMSTKPASGTSEPMSWIVSAISWFTQIGVAVKAR